jgi:Right handed beta helix region
VIVLSALVTAALTVSACSGPPSDTLGPPPVGCISSGAGTAISDVLVGPGDAAVLCPRAVFTLTQRLRFTARDQQIYTQGRPTDGSRAILRVTWKSLTTAIYGVDVSGVVVESVQVDGGRPSLGALGGDALIELGGNASGQTVRSIVAYDTRSWSTIHFTEGAVSGGEPVCHDGVITGNTIGPAGRPDGSWADGISLACASTLVEGNVITDATDGAIVVFGAPGSTIRGNTIIAATQTMLGGINMVDFAPTNGNYVGTTVTGNTIDARGALIKVAIAMGPQVWSCSPGTNFGAAVTGNTLRGDHMGYGFAVNGVRDWTVGGNTDNSHHVGTPTGGCGTTNSPPSGFQVHVQESSSLQPDFVPAEISSVLGLFELGDGVPFGCSNIYPGQRLRAGDSFPSCDRRFALVLDKLGNLRLAQGSTTLWSAPTSAGANATLTLQTDGDLVLTDAAGGVVWTTRTEGHPGTRLQVQDDGNLVLLDAAIVPIWASNTSAGP